MLSFKSTFSLSSITFIKWLFSSSSLSAMRVVSSAYLRLLLFLPAILILACASSSRDFSWCTPHVRLNNQDDDIQPWHTPFPIWNQSVVPCLVLTVASWPAYRFLRRQVSWSGIPISKNSTVCGTSLAVKWLRLCASNARDAGSIPGQGTKIPHATQQGQKINKNN